MGPKKERSSNLELLRIIATLFVIMLHYNTGNALVYTEAMPRNHQVLLAIEMLAICAVNLFVMISGYFLCTSPRVQVWKIIRLYLDVILLSVLMYGLSCALETEAFSVRTLIRRCLPLRWYPAVYAGLYLLSPYLNLILRDSSRSGSRVMLLVFFFVGCLWPFGVELLGDLLNFDSASFVPISANGSGRGYTLINFMLMYFLGAHIRLHGTTAPAGRRVLSALAVYVGCALLNMIMINRYYHHATSYCSPLVIIQAVALFVVFQNIRVQSRIINAVAGCSFGVYLMHASFFPFFQIERFVTADPLIIPVHITVTAILIYAVCALIYWAYQKIMTPVFTVLQRRLRFLAYDGNGRVK